MIKIGYIKSPAKAGERVTVYFENGNFGDRFIANNDITSSEVVVIGNKAFSHDAQVQKLVTTTRLFKSKTNNQEKNCKLVSASLWTALKNVPIAPEEPEITIPEIKLSVNYSTWFYSAEDHACIETTDGRGTYDTAGACMAANSGKFVESFTAKEPYYFNSSNGNTYVSSELGYRLNDVTYERTHEIIPLNASRNQAIADNNIWLERENKLFTFTDGSLIPNPSELGYSRASRRVLDLAAPGNIATFKTITTYVKTITTINGDFEPLPAFRANLAVVGENYIPQSTDVIKRDVQPKPITANRIVDYFIKSHDPNLPPFLAYSRPEAQGFNAYRPYFIYLGNKVYLVFKIGKIPNPDVMFSARSWRQIKVIEVRIAGSSLQVVKETDYFDSEDSFAAISNDVVIKSVVTRFVDNPTNDPTKEILDRLGRGDYCIRNGEYYVNPQFPNELTEVNYQKTDSGIVEYKITGEASVID